MCAWVCSCVCVLIFLPPGVKVSHCTVPKGIFSTLESETVQVFLALPWTESYTLLHWHSMHTNTHTVTCHPFSLFLSLVCSLLYCLLNRNTLNHLCHLSKELYYIDCVLYSGVCNPSVHRCCLWASTMSIFLFSGGEESSSADSRGHHTCFYLVLWQACTFKILKMRPVVDWEQTHTQTHKLVFLFFWGHSLT